ncbi:DUF6495 family protein [Capnocytophaga sp.]|uniref:DUF6495 family protein n=1 Tax=Capnocytophaga sp. TaxID=44737 RepID=UPI0026DC13AB|nr:DUF6495 family protein [Capnocytophaga sp.]MDO5105728.1 DUF6495 family protein [Capnocytophaga sp.]
MKYTRLTKEQLEALHHDFARFLATQQITADEWDTLKKEKPHVAEQEIDIFSDLVWEKSLEKVRFLDKIDRQSLHCFHFEKENAKMISIILHNNQIDLTTHEGFEWLQNNIQSPEVELFTGQKTFTNDYKFEIFKLIEQGSQIADGTLFNTLSEYLKNQSEK